MLEGIFLLLITFTDEPRREFWNPMGPIELSTYTDCLRAGQVISGLIRENHTVTCASKETGEVHATWSLGRAGGG